MSRRLITLFALIVFTLTGLGLPAFASASVTQGPLAEAPCHEMGSQTADRHKKAPASHKDCEGIGCQCALSHCPATLSSPATLLSEPLIVRADFTATPACALETTAPEGLKRPPRA